MNIDEIKDECRKNLNRFTIEAFSRIPLIDKPLILDAGCGSGVPALALIEHCNGVVFAVDVDRANLHRFEKKASSLKNRDRINIINGSIFNDSLFDFKFDIILAEGLLNVIGFEKGLLALVQYLKNGGYLVVHDELKNDPDKRLLFEKCNLKLLYSFRLMEDVWLNEYFYCLKEKIRTIDHGKLYKKELAEIDESISNPGNLRSIYYVLHHAQ